jgi:hypothetical protein
MQDFFPMNGAAKLQDDQKQAKLPDFVSRLRGFLNVHGLNPVNSGEPIPYIRRAILIHSLLKRHASNLANEEGINVEASLLNSLLEAKEYKHGARSIEAIIQMSSLRGIPTGTACRWLAAGVVKPRLPRELHIAAVGPPETFVLGNAPKTPYQNRQVSTIHQAVLGALGASRWPLFDLSTRSRWPCGATH